MGRTAPRASHPMSRLIMAATLVSLVPTCAMAQSLSNPAKDAYWQGRIAYHAGECKLAVGSFAYAARHKIFSSRHYLAKIFGNTDGDLADHAKAFNLLSAIAREYWDIDPAYSFRAKVVSDVLARLGQYHLRGIPQLNMPADRRVATDYFKLAAEDYNNEDAQFALAKLYLKRDDNRWILARGRNWLGKLGNNGHAGALAVLAKSFWYGGAMRRNRVRALASISIALENADLKDLGWISKLHRDLVCKATSRQRKIVRRMLPVLRRDLGRKPDREPNCGVSSPRSPPLQCPNGEPVRPIDDVAFDP